jgi:hypothetical protein
MGIYIGCTEHEQAVGELSEANFFIIYIGCTGHVQTLGEVSGQTFFHHIYRLYSQCRGPKGSLWTKIFIIYIWSLQAMYRLQGKSLEQIFSSYV